MEPTSVFVRLFVLLAHVSILATNFFTTLTDARVQLLNFEGSEVSRRTIYKSEDTKVDKSYGLITPLSPAPLAPPDKFPPLCMNPPSTYTPHLPFQSPPPGTPQSPNPPEHAPTPPTSTPTPPHYGPNPPQYSPSPPKHVSSPPQYTPNPPKHVSSPPQYTPSPPKHVPSPPQHTPSPPIHQPPTANPPPPPHKRPQFAVWCVVKPTVPDPIVQEALDYACGSGADCKSIQPNRPCFQPNTLFSHASYAFNSYWQSTKLRGGTCDFGGTAMLVTTDPSFDDCHFICK